MKSVELCDVTLREGEQTPGAVFSTEDKLEIARMLDEIGVAQIQVSFPGLDRKRLEETGRICGLQLRCRTEVMTNGMLDNWREQIDAACDCGPTIVHSMVDSRAACASESSMCEVLERIQEACDFIHERGRLCNISFIGAFDAKCDKLTKLIGEVSSIADRVRVADSYGIASPESFGKLVGDMVKARAGRKTEIGVHCHNDMGLAMANMLSSVEAGADFVDVSINGLGSRAGNVSLAECAYVLDKVYHRISGMKLDRLTELTARTAQLCGIPVSPYVPLVGSRVFDEEIDIHVMEILNDLPRRGILPETVGGQAHALYGKLTTPDMLRCVAKKAGRTLPEKRLGEIVDVLKNYSLTHRGEVIEESGLWNVIDQILTPS